MSLPEEQNKSAYSEPDYAKGGKDKSSSWYLGNIDSQLVPETRQLLIEYSKVPPDQLSRHIHDIVSFPPKQERGNSYATPPHHSINAKSVFQRDRAWAVRSYPCTGLGVWLVPSISRSPAYADILKRMHEGGVFLDVGCFLGQDMRRLFFDGAPSTSLYGVDIVSHWDVGFALFQDQDRFFGHFIEADVLAPNPAPALQQLEAHVDVLTIFHILHQWDWKDQVTCAKRLVAFTRGVGSVIVGVQIGNINAGESISRTFQVPQYRHNPASMARMWDQVGAETGTKWETQAWLRTWEDMGWDRKNHTWQEDTARVIEFVVTRV